MSLFPENFSENITLLEDSVPWDHTFHLFGIWRAFRPGTNTWNMSRGQVFIWQTYSGYSIDVKTFICRSYMCSHCFQVLIKGCNWPTAMWAVRTLKEWICQYFLPSEHGWVEFDVIFMDLFVSDGVLLFLHAVWTWGEILLLAPPPHLQGGHKSWSATKHHSCLLAEGESSCLCFC